VQKVFQIFLILVLGATSAYCAKEDLFLTENKGQWHDAVHYRADIPSGHLYLDHDGFTYQLFDEEVLANIHHNRTDYSFESMRMHVVKTRFIGSNPASGFERSEPSVHYSNYFIGSDSARWASDVRSFEWVKRKDLYNGIDLQVYRKNDMVKYDLIVAPGADLNQIELEYDGAEKLELIDGQLHVYTSLQSYIEQPPFAYQVINGRFRKVECHYALDGQTLRFDFPNGYDEQFELVIDPEISFSTYIGSVSSNFGYTATYDDDGNLYAGVIVFGALYPTTAGAFDEGYNGGSIDVGITKFNANGTQLIYSTFLGGSGQESPHSLVVNGNNELFILGSVGSANFPTTAGVVQPAFAGGPQLTFNVGYGFSHLSGTDIFISKLSADGTNLLASTYFGGSGNDGINSDGNLEYNYGDAFRGEIVVDDAGSVYVSSVTSSTNFPVSATAFQTTYGGGTTDGCVFKLNGNLNNIMWSSYLGGSSADASFSVQLAEDGTVYVAGATMSQNLPATPGALHTTSQGGIDGFAGRISANGQNLMGLTYIGTSAYDEVFFIQLDTEGNPFVVGQTEGNFPVSGGVYNNPNSGQFIQKLNPDLTQSLLSTVVGNGNGGPNISISAFLVSNCNQIYVSGWGGATNSNAAQVMTSTTNGLPTTPNAFQSTTDGSDFYLMVLSPDAEELVYGTFFGGASSNEHVDGGTSRFDKRGTVYQAVCAGCGGYDDFPTQPGVWSETNSASLANGQCNLGVFKFDLSTIAAQIAIDGPDVVCAGANVNFINNTIGADQFQWDFGGLGGSSATNPSFVFDEPGVYTITMIADDFEDCIQPDTTQISITVVPAPDIDVSGPQSVCAGDSVQLFVDGGEEYLWSPAGQVDDPTSSSPTVWVNETTTFTVLTTATCGQVSDEVVVSVLEEDYGTGEDQTICLGQSVQISAFGGGSYSWTPANSVNNPNSASPTVTPEENTTYTVEITSPNGCTYEQNVVVTVLTGTPETETIGVAAICGGGSTGIWASGGDEYAWDPVPGLNNYNIANPIASPTESTWYYVNVSNLCGSTPDSVFVHVGTVIASIAPPDTVCPNEPITLQASGGVQYLWSPESYLSNHQIANPVATPPLTMTYSVIVFDEFGCYGIASTVVPVYPAPYLIVSADQVVSYYDYTTLEAITNGELYWESDLWLSCNECPSPEAHATETNMVYAVATDENGCTSTDSVLVQVTGSIYVPNAFTPNGDGINEIFKARGTEIKEFHMQIFNRWGELIFESHDIDEGWNGGVNRHYVQPEVYVWKIRAKEHTGHAFDLQGHVTVVR